MRSESGRFDNEYPLIVGEVSLVRLPSLISAAVDAVVGLFVDTMNSRDYPAQGLDDLKQDMPDLTGVLRGLESQDQMPHPIKHLPYPMCDTPGKFCAYRRWHGADLWIILSDTLDHPAQGAIVTYILTIGTYSDRPDYLSFIPDIVVTRSSGRYTIPFPEKLASASDEELGVQHLDLSWLSGQTPAELAANLWRKIASGWVYGQTMLSAEDATLLQ